MSSSPTKLQQLLKKEAISFSPIDIFNKDFDKGRMFSRRYNADQVDEFLDKVVKDYERMYKLLDDMLVEVEALRESVTNKGEISVELLHVRLRKVEHFLQSGR